MYGGAGYGDLGTERSKSKTKTQHEVSDDGGHDRRAPYMENKFFQWLLKCTKITNAQMHKFSRNICNMYSKLIKIHKVNLASAAVWEGSSKFVVGYIK